MPITTVVTATCPSWCISNDHCFGPEVHHGNALVDAECLYASLTSTPGTGETVVFTEVQRAGAATGSGQENVCMVRADPAVLRAIGQAYLAAADAYERLLS